MIPQPDLRNVMIPVFHDMMDWEQRRSGNFKQVGAAPRGVRGLRFSLSITELPGSTLRGEVNPELAISRPGSSLASPFPALWPWTPPWSYVALSLWEALKSYLIPFQLKNCVISHTCV